MSAPEHPSGSGAPGPDASSRAARRVVAQWPFILACGVAGCLAAYVLSTQRVPQYEASTSIRVGSPNLVGQLVERDAPSAAADVERETASVVASFNLPSVRERAASMLEGTITSSEIGRSLAVAAKTNTNIVKVVFRDPDPRQAQRVSSAVTRAFIANRIDATRKKLVVSKSQIRRQHERLSVSEARSPAGVQLKTRLTQIDTLAALADGNVEIIQTAREPEQAVSPRPKRDSLLGFLTGLGLGTLLTVVRTRLDDRIRFAGELADIWDLPVVGLVPQSNELKGAWRTVPSADALEALSLARTNLRYLRMGTDVKTLVLTSAMPNEGKSTLTWNLAIAASLAGTRVVVVEADLRRPVLTERLALEGPGLSEVLAGIAPLEDAITAVEISGADGTTAATVDIVAAGMVPPNPVALFEGQPTADVFAELRERYEVVLIDTPPATVFADALSILSEADGVLVVSRVGVVRRGPFQRLREILVGADAPVLGQLVNSERLGARSHAWGYGAAAYGTPHAADSSRGSRPFWRRLTPARWQA